MPTTKRPRIWPEWVDVPEFKEGRTWRFVVQAGRLLSLNTERQMNRHAANDEARMWREMARVEAQNARIPHLDHASFIMWPCYASKLMPDCANTYPTVKAIVDGVVDAGVLADDGWTKITVDGVLVKTPRVTSVEQIAPRWCGWDGMIVVVGEQILKSWTRRTWDKHSMIPRSAQLT